MKKQTHWKKFRCIKPIPLFEEDWKVGEIKDNYCNNIFFNRFKAFTMAELAILIINGYVEEEDTETCLDKKPVAGGHVGHCDTPWIRIYGERIDPLEKQTQPSPIGTSSESLPFGEGGNFYEGVLGNPIFTVRDEEGKEVASLFDNGMASVSKFGYSVETRESPLKPESSWEESFWILEKKYNLMLDNENYDDLMSFAKEYEKRGYNLALEETEKLENHWNDFGNRDLNKYEDAELRGAKKVIEALKALKK